MTGDRPGLLAIMGSARGRGDWALADDLRDRVAAAGIEVRDTPDGTVWLPAEL